jgi:adenylate cyclase
MVDIRGFTHLTTTVKPDDLVCLLAEYQSRIVPIIQRHGGTIDKFMGDGIMATFGAAVTSPTYAADALKTVDDIMEAASTWGAELQQEGKPLLKMGAAVATGRIIFGAVGDESRMEYTVIGDAVNLSAKLEKHTKSEGVRALCTAPAFDVAVRQGYQPSSTIERRKSRQIEGVAPPVDIIVLAP